MALYHPVTRKTAIRVCLVKTSTLLTDLYCRAAKKIATRVFRAKTIIPFTPHTYLAIKRSAIHAILATT
jgi:hypothetical protein